MNTDPTEYEKFKSEDFNISLFPAGEYDNCTFTDCFFTNFNFSGFTFSECEFINCDMSMANIRGVPFRDVDFQGCKLLGLRFDECNPFLLSLQFENCILNFSSFYKLKIRKTVFDSCKMEQVDFTETDLSTAIFRKCDLSGAVFSDTNLEKTDLLTAENFNIDPESNKIKGAKFSKQNLHGLLLKYNIVIQ